jgi:hypothetical protein
MPYQEIFDNVAASQEAITILTQPIVKMEPLNSINPFPASHIRLRDTQLGTFFPKQRITFQLPRVGLLDTSSLRLGFTLRPLVKTNVASQVQFPYDISTVFSNLKIFHGQTTIESINEYGFLTQRIGLLFEESGRQPGQLIAEGKQGASSGGISSTPTNLHRSVYHARAVTSQTEHGVPRRYLINLNSGLLSQRKYIPLDTFNGDLRIELTVQDYNKCVFLGNTNTYTEPPTFEISRTFLLFKQFNMDTLFQKQYSEMLKQNRLTFQFVSWDHMRYNLNDQTMQRISIPTNRRYLKFALAFIRNEIDITTVNADPTSTYCSLYPGFNFTGTNLSNDRTTMIRSYQWRIGNYRVPEEAVECNATQSRLSSTSGPSNLLIDATNQFGTPAVEAYYYIQELGRILNRQVSGAYQNNEYTFGQVDSFSTGTALQPTNNAVNPRGPSSFTIVGIFSHTLPNGRVVCMNAGNTNNDPLVLNVLFNNKAIDATGAIVTQPMYMDIFTCYDNYLTVSEEGDSILDN